VRRVCEEGNNSSYSLDSSKRKGLRFYNHDEGYSSRTFLVACGTPALSFTFCHFS
jgi:hypothetical protein